MMILLSLIAYISCNILIFWYAEKVFTIIAINKVQFITILLFNTSLFVIYLHFTTHITESMIMLAFFTILYFEFKIIFRSDIYITFFGTFCFVTCLSSFKMIIISLISFANDVSASVFIASFDNKVLISVITLFTMSVYLFLLEKIMPMSIITMAISNKRSTVFSLGILTSIVLFLLFNKDLIYLENNTLMITLLNLKNGLFGFLGFGLVLLYAYIFSVLSLNKEKCVFVQQQIVAKENQIANLELNINMDSSTKLATRSVAQKVILSNLKCSKPFFIIFIDLDGLKFSNDNYGHSEGDFYIKSVADTIAHIFCLDTTVRFGGDEFLVIIDSKDEYYVNQKILLCCANVKQLKKTYQKPYDTSISYGIVEVKFPTNYTLEQIIDIADKKMYEFKKRNKKHRV